MFVQLPTVRRPAFRSLRLSPTGWGQFAQRKKKNDGPMGTYRNERLPGRTIEFIINPTRLGRINRRLIRRLRADETVYTFAK